MFDKEIEAIAKCTELIKELDDSARIRVIKYIIERFGIGNNSNGYFQSQGQQAPKALISDSDQDTSFIQVENNDYLTIKQLVIKNYPKNETEWILCLAFYSSNFGNDTFKKDDVIEKYRESNRYTENNRKNFANNLNSCIKKDWIKDVNKDEYILKPEGITYAKEIFNGNSTAKEVKKVTRKVKSIQE